MEALPLMCFHNLTQVAFRNFNKKGFENLIRNRPSVEDNKRPIFIRNFKGYNLQGISYLVTNMYAPIIKVLK